MCAFFFLCPCLGFQSPWGKIKLMLCYIIAYSCHIWSCVVVACATCSGTVVQYYWKMHFCADNYYSCSICGQWDKSFFRIKITGARGWAPLMYIWNTQFMLSSHCECELFAVTACKMRKFVVMTSQLHLILIV